MLVRVVTFSRGLSIAFYWINLVFIHTFDMPFTVQQLHQWRLLCRSWPIPSKVRDRILELGCGRLTRRGCRAGARSREHRDQHHPAISCSLAVVGRATHKSYTSSPAIACPLQMKVSLFVGMTASLFYAQSNL